jgi:hypothetical protein
MNFEELEEALDDILPPGYSIETNKHGQIIILSNLRQDEDGELHTFQDDEVDPDADPDFDPLDDEELEEDE